MPVFMSKCVRNTYRYGSEKQSCFKRLEKSQNITLNQPYLTAHFTSILCYLHYDKFMILLNMLRQTTYRVSH
jgi:hypothetical protein